MCHSSFASNNNYSRPCNRARNYVRIERGGNLPLSRRGNVLAERDRPWLSITHFPPPKPDNPRGEGFFDRSLGYHLPIDRPKRENAAAANTCHKNPANARARDFYCDFHRDREQRSFAEKNLTDNFRSGHIIADYPAPVVSPRASICESNVEQNYEQSGRIIENTRKLGRKRAENIRNALLRIERWNDILWFSFE